MSTAQSLGNELARESSPHSNIDEDEQQSAAESIDSSELSNRLAVLVPTMGESEENTRDSTVDSTTARSPMDVDSNTITQVLDENQSIDTTVSAVPGPLFTIDETSAEEPSTNEDFREILGGFY